MLKKIINFLSKNIHKNHLNGDKADFSHSESQKYFETLSDYDGYRREASLKYFINKAISGDKSFSYETLLPHILERINDWVPEVRKTANKAFYVIVPMISITQLVKNYRSIEVLTHKRRADLKSYKNFIFEQIQCPENKEEIISILKTASYKERLFCWRALIKSGYIEPSLLNIGLQDSHSKIRYVVVSYKPEHDEFKFIKKLFFTEKSAYVRYAMLKAIPKEKIADYKDLLELAIFDNAASVRLCSRYMLTTMESYNFPDIYRSALMNNRKDLEIGAICGFAECQPEIDFNFLEPFLTHPNARVRSSVLKGLNKMKSSDLDEINLKALHDCNSKVRRDAVNILKSGHRYLKNRLEKIAVSDDEKAKEAASRVLAHYPKNIKVFWNAPA